MKTGAKIACSLILISALTAGCQTPSGISSRSMQSKESREELPSIITGLNFPISMAFSPDKRIFITEKAGQIKIVKDGKVQNRPFATVDVPRIRGYSEAGLLGIALDPKFSKERPFVYFYHSFEKNGRIFNRVARVKDEGNRAADYRVVVDDIPGDRIHNGGIIAFGPDGKLYIATGDANSPASAQDVRSLNGKILRVNPDGSIPADNPFPGSPVFSLGHRNQFGLAFNPKNGRLYATENGTDKNDEINLITAGGNYGWPIALGPSTDRRFKNPIKTYESQIAPTQALFYTGRKFPGSRGDLFIGSYLEGSIHRLKLAGADQDRVSSDDKVYSDPAGRGIIGIAQAPDGSIYAITEKEIRKVNKLAKEPF